MNTQDEIIPEEVQDNGTAAETAEPTEPTLEELLIAAQEEAGRNLEGWQRALADLANARKRFDKQSQMAYSNATVDLVSKLLPVIDDLDRGMGSVPADVAGTSWFDGLKGIQRKLATILEGIQAERIVSVGEPFDPNQHDAIMSEASADHESGIVIRELQAGYRIGERVIRPAMVVVAA
jgi:molecular chaperone GrpE